MNNTHEQYMARCLTLALKGAGYVAPNPMVGAVLVYQGLIIGEGYHEQYGEAHAEVNCINSVSTSNKNLIPLSTIYVSLEPCVHFGKTPPCADLIIQHQIKKVVVGCRDPFVSVNGKGIEKLKYAGVEVIENISEAECKAINKRFFTFHQQQRPYIILKWAQTANVFIGNQSNERLHITNEITNRLAHKWRSEEAAILIGTNTALKDNPQLTNRLYSGKSPLRLVIDLELKLPRELVLFTDGLSLVVFNYHKETVEGVIQYKQLDATKAVLPQIMQIAYQMNIQSILVEGGAKLLQSFIDEALWDEARVITNTELIIEQGIAVPILSNEVVEKKEQFTTDSITYFLPYHEL